MMRRLRRLMRKMVGPGAAALTLGMLVPLGAQALPTGGQVVAGQAAIAQNGSQMTITQSSDKAILNWQGFDIGAQERVTFAQPSTSSVALNRVVGNTASAIYGGMDANGQVFLVNQNGVYFAPGAQVSAGGLLVSTLGISDSDFMAGRLNFSGDSTAGVTNDGTIRAGQGGYVAFIGRHVDNEGQIITPGGKTALGAGGARLRWNMVANLVPGDFSISGFVPGDQIEVTQGRRDYASTEVGTLMAVTADLSSGDFRAIGGHRSGQF
ncbi:filamentous hemagglutinin N-terminal domain-containing protein [Thioclava sp. 15-R06ZXC-3]|uniref:Filamentous hemagglutinin N-terminal domain-containing protein n=1 Tax=Thioclava arctica TaxID=3238301 RepID=A0ABV3TJI2_9RHOB